MAKTNVYVDFRSLTAKLRYFYKQVKSISGDDDLKIEILRTAAEYAKNDSTLLYPIPYYTGALESSTPGLEDVDGIKKTVKSKKNRRKTIRTNYAKGWVDVKGIHWSPYTITKDGEFYYAELDKVVWNPAEKMEDQAIIEDAVLQALFQGENGFKKLAPYGVSKKNEYILDLGQVK